MIHHAGGLLGRDTRSAEIAERLLYHLLMAIKTLPTTFHAHCDAVGGLDTLLHQALERSSVLEVHMSCVTM